MREIKFRVWTGSQMEYNIMAGFLGAFYVQGIDEKDSASMSPFNTNYHPDTPLMQYTGLKDKNGKEIYESDILLTETEKPMVVTWSETFASFCIHRDGWAFQHWFGEACDPKNCEVIGNIYENESLIK